MDIRRKNKKQQQLSILLMLAIVAVAAGCLALFLRSPSSPESAVTAQPVTDPQALDPNQVEMQDPDSFSPNQEGEFVYTLNATPYFAAGDKAGTLLLLNHGSNEYDMQVDIVLPGETVYQSGVIPAGCQVSEGLLNRPLPKGKYPATALLHILDPMDGEILGELEQPVTLYIATNG